MKYLITIYRLNKYGNVRSVEIANFLGVSKSSVNCMLNKSSMAEYFDVKPRGKVNLSGRGLVEAEMLNYGVEKFIGFLSNKIDEDSAEKEAINILCSMSNQNLKKFVSKKEVFIMPVVIAPVNQELKIIKIMTDERTKKHLESLGIAVNGNLTVLSSSGGSVVLLIKDCRLALDRNIATKILVC